MTGLEIVLFLPWAVLIILREKVSSNAPTLPSLKAVNIASH